MGSIVKHRAGTSVLFAFLAAFPAATYGQAHAHMTPPLGTETRRPLTENR